MQFASIGGLYVRATATAVQFVMLVSPSRTGGADGEDVHLAAREDQEEIRQFYDAVCIEFDKRCTLSVNGDLRRCGAEHDPSGKAYLFLTQI